MTAGMTTAREAAKHPVQDLDGKYAGTTLRSLASCGMFASNTDVALSLSTDGFEGSRQMGFQGWPVIVTVLNLPPVLPTRNVCQILVTVPPGAKQPRYRESFLQPIAEELNILAKGNPGVKVFGAPALHTLRTRMHQLTTYMHAGDMLLNAVGHVE